MEIGVISLFPEIFKALELGITGRAIERQLIHLQYWNPRSFTQDKYGKVDDKSYGGGPGMVMAIQPLKDAIHTAKAALSEKPVTIYVSPQGKRFDQAAAKSLSKRQSMLFLAGRYEGVDERLLETTIDEEWSIGDYVLSGGEFAIMVMIDAITRLLPGALGDETSAENDSFSNGLLDHPHYTRPEIFEGLEVPKILLSGNHQKIEWWRKKQSLGRTYLRRPDLLKNRILSQWEQTLLNEFIQEEH